MLNLVSAMYRYTFRGRCDGGKLWVQFFSWYFMKIGFSKMFTDPPSIIGLSRMFVLWWAGGSRFPCQHEQLQATLRFTMEKENDCAPLFLDFLVQRYIKVLLRSFQHMPTLTALYTDWESYVPSRRKINMINTPARRALTICFLEGWKN